MFDNSKEIIEFFEGREMSSEAQAYIHVHAKRYAFLLAWITTFRERFSQLDTVTMLDIGPSFFTELYRVKFPEDKVMTLGLDSPECRGGHLPFSIQHDAKNHIHFNLNDAQNREKWIKTILVDLVVMAEVIEHLYTSPRIILEFVCSLIRPNGFLIIETPNAATLKKRLKLLRGRNPYDMIRVNADNPGHFREYTVTELVEIARKVGFEVHEVMLSNYFSHDSTKNRIEKFLRGLGPKSFHRGITMLMKKPDK